MDRNAPLAAIAATLVVGLVLAPAASASLAPDVAPEVTDRPKCIQVPPFSDLCSSDDAVTTPEVSAAECLAVYPFCGGDLVDWLVDQVTEPLP